MSARNFSKKFQQKDEQKERLIEMGRLASVEEVLWSHPQLSKISVEDKPPIYEHDCELCVFLGTCHIENSEFKDFDVYFCENDIDGTVIFRHGTHGDYYSSGSGYSVGDFRVPALYD